MAPCCAVEMHTPKGVRLRGLWFGPKKPKKCVVWVHGLGGSVFSMSSVVRAVADAKTAVLVFNNRGHDQVSFFSIQRGEQKVRVQAGAAHEVFEESVDDIDGAVQFVRAQGVRSVYLAGHSTGCQKSVLWSVKRRGKGVKGIILLAPISDWAAEMHLRGKRRVQRVERVARKLVAAKRPHALLPEGLWHEPFDAQRFLSLYTPDSIEEIFSYAQSEKNPRLMRAVTLPTLVLLAEKDAFADRSALELSEWFKKHLQNRCSVVVCLGVGHGFDGAEQEVAASIRSFIWGQNVV